MGGALLCFFCVVARAILTNLLCAESLNLKTLALDEGFEPTVAGW